MFINENKTISANSRGVIICYGDANRHKFIGYESISNEKKYNPLESTSKYQELEKPVFSKVQYKLYYQTIYGFGAYEESELKAMPKIEINRIVTRYTKATRILAIWRQEIITNRVNEWLSSLNVRSSIVKQLLAINGYDSEIKETVSFKDLGIPIQTVAGKLVEHKLLPENFFELA